jgi:hypothetical protein
LGAHENHYRAFQRRGHGPLLKPGAVTSLNLPKRPDGGAPKLGIIFSGGNVDFSSLPF